MRHLSLAGHRAVDLNPRPRKKLHTASAVSNGSVLLPGVDGRSAWARRCRDVLAEHLSDLGGELNTSAAERSIIRRAAVLTTELERMEQKFALAGQASPEALDIYARVAANLRRLLEAVGLQRRSKDVTPSLAEYLRQKTVTDNDGAAEAAE